MLKPGIIPDGDMSEVTVRHYIENCQGTKRP